MTWERTPTTNEECASQRGQTELQIFRGRYRIEIQFQLSRLKSLIDALGQGHRVNFDSELKEELRQFVANFGECRFHYREPIKDMPCRDSCSALTRNTLSVNA